MISITGTLVWYYYICTREVWFMGRYIEPYQENIYIELGRLISEESYKREDKEIRLENIVIDISRMKDGNLIIGEVKKSSKFEKSAKMQLCYYLYILKQNCILAKGELLFPKEKKKIYIELTDDIERELELVTEKIKEIITMEKPPQLKRIPFCSKCAYMEMCWV
uniref:CRISPR-associated exonuclease Cas4 n=1 Tax=candidate division WOR-3 bacterium TaxID=2052148 RepID=A0A7C3N9K3_UNCW3